MKRNLYLSAVTLCTLCLLFPASRAQQDTPTPSSTPAKSPAKSTPESRGHAKKLYEVDCAMCHNSNGDGKTDLAKDMQLTLRDWSDPKSLANKTDGDLFDVIRAGKDKMPPEVEGRAKNDEVWGLVLYIRSLAKTQTDVTAK